VISSADRDTLMSYCRRDFKAYEVMNTSK